MFEDSLTYLKDSDDAAKTVLIGGLLGVFGFLILPALVVQGYVIRVLNRVASGDTDAPTFDDWGTLLVDGLKAVVIAFVYLLVPTVVGAVLIGGGAALANDASLVGGAIAVIGGVATLVLGLAVLYVLPAGLVRFARTDRLGGAFEFGALRPILADREYATGWLLALGVLIVAGLVGSVLAAIPVLGWLAAFFVGFYAQVTAAYLYARSYANADEHRVESGPGVEGKQPAV